MPKALICGGGIGGLAAAVALVKVGWEVELYERHSELRTAGAGLNVWPNGARVIAGLGLGDEFASMSTALTSYKTYSAAGELLNDEDLTGWPARFGGALCGVYRRDLNALLADTLGAERINYGHELVSIDDDGSQVEATFVNGVKASGDIFIGADGTYSTARTCLFGEQPLRDDGFVRWRGMFDLADVDVEPLTEAEVLGEHGHLGWLPIGKGRAYWFAAGAGLVERDAFWDHFSSWTDSVVPALLEATHQDTVISNVLQDLVTPLERWGAGRATLMGDAAHPMLPGMAQGANQALQDAAVLAQSLANATDYEQALRAYEDIRMPIGHLAVELSRPLFDFSSQHDEYESQRSNPIFARYADGIEGGRF